MPRASGPSPPPEPTRVVLKLTSLLNNQTSFGEHLPGLQPHPHLQVHGARQQSRMRRIAVGTKTFFVDASTGPFVVTYPNNNITRPGNSDLTILAGQQARRRQRRLCLGRHLLQRGRRVHLALLLAEAVDNDGEHSVLLPPRGHQPSPHQGQGPRQHLL